MAKPFGIRTPFGDRFTVHLSQRCVLAAHLREAFYPELIEPENVFFLPVTVTVPALFSIMNCASGDLPPFHHPCNNQAALWNSIIRILLLAIQHLNNNLYSYIIINNVNIIHIMKHPGQIFSRNKVVPVTAPMRSNASENMNGQCPCAYACYPGDT